MTIGRYTPTQLFDSTTTGATLSKTLFPGVYTALNGLPAPGNVTTLLNSTPAVVGGLIAVAQSGWGNLLLDFAGVGSSTNTATVEIGKVYGSGMMAVPLASVVLTAAAAGTFSVNPFTGATAVVTWRLFDATTITLTGGAGLGQVLQNVGGNSGAGSSQLLLDVTEAPYYYVMLTAFSSITELLCCVTPY